MLWLNSSLSTIVIGAALLVAVAISVLTIVKNKKSGCSSCGSCSGCAFKGQCNSFSGD